jgi:hypothetical protein
MGTDNMKFWKFGVVAAACAACCAPLLVPFFASSAFVGLGAAGVGYFESIESGMIVLGLGLMAVWFYRRRMSVAKACACAPDAGCNAGAACEVQQAKHIPTN